MCGAGRAGVHSGVGGGAEGWVWNGEHCGGMNGLAVGQGGRSGLGNLEASPLVVQDGGLLFPLGPRLWHRVEAVDGLS